MNKQRKWKTLDGTLDRIWTLLKQGVDHFDDPFHWPVLGTQGEDGTSQQRTVIFRELIRSDRILVCHTDKRAAKVHDIEKNHKISWLFYHPENKVQLRISGQATLHGDDAFADRQWAATKITSRLSYFASHPPGTTVEKPSSGIPDVFLKTIPSLLESEKGRKHFMAIACKIDSIDFLVLRILGHRRARFEWKEDNYRATWLVP
jgi:pyridoxamine 5'-phosphate oxidase